MKIRKMFGQSSLLSGGLIRLLFGAYLALMIGSGPASGESTVTNVRAGQKGLGGTVEISYDLVSDTSNWHEVSVEVSPDDGVSWEAASAVTGDVGEKVQAGSRSVIWEAGTQWSADLYSNAKVRIDAVDTGTGPVASPMAAIAGGQFLMGDADNNAADEKPAWQVQVSAFQMDVFEVSKGDWDRVRLWGLARGYVDLAVGQRGAASGSGLPASAENDRHPVTRISWYDALKWCNARSEMEGLTPVYHVSDAKSAQTVCRSGDVVLTAAMVDWDAYGNRLPTEPEWEFAGRGGMAEKDHPWSRTSPLSWLAGICVTMTIQATVGGELEVCNPSHCRNPLFDESRSSSILLQGGSMLVPQGKITG